MKIWIRKLLFFSIILLFSFKISAQKESNYRIYAGESFNNVIFFVFDEILPSKFAMKVYPISGENTNPKILLPNLKTYLIQTPDLFKEQNYIKDNIIIYNQTFYSFLGSYNSSLVFHIKIENDLLKFDQIVTQGSFYPNFSKDIVLKRIE